MNYLYKTIIKWRLCETLYMSCSWRGRFRNEFEILYDGDSSLGMNYCRAIELYWIELVTLCISNFKNDIRFISSVFNLLIRYEIYVLDNNFCNFKTRNLKSEVDVYTLKKRRDLRRSDSSLSFSSSLIFCCLSFWSYPLPSWSL